MGRVVLIFPVMGTHCPSCPSLCFSLFTHPYGNGPLFSHWFTDNLHPIHTVNNFYVPSRSSSGPQPSYSSPHVFPGSMVILRLCHKSITPLPQLYWLKVLARLLSLILHLGFLLQFNLSCLPELAQPRA